MLVLKRNIDEHIDIGDDIKVTVVDVKGNSVYLGVDAPKKVPVNRGEVTEAIQRGEGRSDDSNSSD